MLTNHQTLIYSWFEYSLLIKATHKNHKRKVTTANLISQHGPIQSKPSKMINREHRTKIEFSCANKIHHLCKKKSVYHRKKGQHRQKQNLNSESNLSVKLVSKLC